MKQINYKMTIKQGLKMTPSQKAKNYGLASLAQVAELTKQSPQTLANWHKNKPELFRVVLIGCALSLAIK